MKKELRCRDLGHKCDFVVRDESEDDILRVFIEHMPSAHNVTFTKELSDKAKSMIRKAA